MGLRRNIQADGTTNYNYRFLSFDLGLIWQIVAIMISWATHKSIGWAIIHGLFSGLYILYWAITGQNANEAGLTEMVEYYKTFN